MYSMVGIYLVVSAFFGGLINLGKLELVFTALFQTFGPIGIILLLLGVLVLLIPQARRFIGSLI
ncbi:MAG: hypothetical protein ACFE95_22190 [Candidatus Hodarchaeota archaeon]